MKSCLRKLKAYIKANPTRFDDNCPLPALDSLYWRYTECHTMSNAKPNHEITPQDAAVSDITKPLHPGVKLCLEQVEGFEIAALPERYLSLRLLLSDDFRVYDHGGRWFLRKI